MKKDKPFNKNEGIFKKFNAKDFAKVLSLKKNLQNFIVSDADLTGLESYLAMVNFDSPIITISVENSKMNNKDLKAFKGWCSSTKRKCTLKNIIV